jgi:hypothetical protein
MKKIGLLFLLIGVVLAVVSCGPVEPVVEANAAEINASATDLGEGFTLTEESDLTAVLERVNVKSEDKGALTDANRRVFISAAPLTTTENVTGTQVVVTVMVYNAAGAAQTGFNETRDALKTVVADDIALVAVNAATVGDQSELWAAEVPSQEANVYLFLGRRLNVLIVVMATGSSELTQTWVLGLGQTLINRVPVATAK